MASLSQMKVFNDFAYLAATETIDQQVRLFNEASAGTIQLSSARNVGDYSNIAMYQNIAGLIRFRNPYGTGSVSEVDLSQLQYNTVKVSGGTPPVAFTPQQFTHLQRSEEEAATMIGQQFAEAQFQQMLNSALASGVAATLNNSAVVHDGTAGTTTLRALNRGAAKFGDRSQAIRAWVIHGLAIHDLWDNSLANGEELFRFGDVAIMSDPFGRRFVITDSPSLVVDQTVDEFRTLGLVEGGIAVGDNNDLRFNLDTRNGFDNIKTTWQAEYTFQLGVKGYSWDLNWNGGTPAGPSLAALSTGANWDKSATFDKDTAGVLVRTSAVV